MDVVINVKVSRDIRDKGQRVFSYSIDPKSIRERWDAQVDDARRGRKYKDARGVLRGL